MNIKGKQMTVKDHAEKLLEIKKIVPRVFKGILEEIENMSNGGNGGPYANGRPVRDVFYTDKERYTDDYFKELLKILKR